MNLSEWFSGREWSNLQIQSFEANGGQGAVGDSGGNLNSIEAVFCKWREFPVVGCQLSDRVNNVVGCKLRRKLVRQNIDPKETLRYVVCYHHE